MKNLMSLLIACMTLHAQTLTDAQARCRALKGAEIDDHGTLIKVWGPFTNFVAAAAGEGPSYCQVTGFVAPSVGFEMRLPATWNGKVLELGCGGECGYIAAPACRGPLERGYACIATDTGHRGQGGFWAANDVDALIDYAYRAVHVVAIAGREIAGRYYGTPPRHAYFFGCSTGGRQALIEAQRFPRDFDGIIAGAPWIRDTDSAANFLWAARALRDANGTSLFTAADLGILHEGALAACDAKDGAADGIIADPSQCAFDPRTLVCAAGQHARCLSAEQIEAARKVYDGPRDSAGRSLLPRGPMPGSELNWIDFGSGGGYIDGEGHSAENETDAKTYFRYLTIPPASAQWTPRDFDFDNDPARFSAGVQESLLAATNPDLRKFRDAGGKLLVYHGWNDESSMPSLTIDYYDTVTRVMGGETATRDFMRLFLVPGMNHCGGGDGPFAVDWLTALEAWVERGIAPDNLSAVRPKTLTDTDTMTYAPIVRKFPVAPADATLTGTVRPYRARSPR